MYSTCLFCNNELGTNESIEHFPVGRRLAYDSAKGRLWVVCRRCERWNLSPLETRWEAIQEAERAFRATKLRVSTDNIGLAQLRDGTELVRIGAPVRAEFAAWRYGDQFGRRWRKYAIGTAAVSVAPVAMGVTQLANFANQAWFHNTGMVSVLAIGAAAGISFSGLGFQFARNIRDRRSAAVVRDAADRAIRVSRQNMDSSIIIAPQRGETPRVLLTHLKPLGPAPKWLTTEAHRKQQHWTDVTHTTLTGDTALRALATMLPHVNRLGGSRRTVQAAVNSIDSAAVVADLLQLPAPGWWRTNVHGVKPNHHGLSSLPAPIRLALEMSLHESDERRAMEGELHELERRWQEADAIAKIADDLFLPANVDERLRAVSATKSEHG